MHVLLKIFVRCLDARAVRHDQPGVSLSGNRFGSLTPWELKRIRKLRRVSSIVCTRKQLDENRRKRQNQKKRSRLEIAARKARMELCNRFRVPHNHYEAAFPATENGVLLATCLALYASGLSVSDGRDTTIFDTGASSSLFWAEKWFIGSTLVPCAVEIVVANGQKMMATHRGVAVVHSVDESGNGTTVRLQQSLLVPDLQHNLISTQ